MRMRMRIMKNKGPNNPSRSNQSVNLRFSFQEAGLLKSSDFFIFNETRTKLQIAPDIKLASTQGTSPPTPTIKQHTKYL